MRLHSYNQTLRKDLQSLAWSDGYDILLSKKKKKVDYKNSIVENGPIYMKIWDCMRVCGKISNCPVRCLSRYWRCFCRWSVIAFFVLNFFFCLYLRSINFIIMQTYIFFGKIQKKKVVMEYMRCSEGTYRGDCWEGSGKSCIMNWVLQEKICLLGLVRDGDPGGSDCTNRWVEVGESVPECDWDSEVEEDNFPRIDRRQRLWAKRRTLDNSWKTAKRF